MLFHTCSRRLMLASAAFIATALASPMTHAVTRHVPGDAPTIQIAINLSSSGDEVIVAPGIYFEAINLSGKTLTIRSSAGPQTTIIDAFGQFTPVVRIIAGEGSTTLIEGFTLRNGQATSAAPGDRGGGIRTENTSPTIRNCTIANCTAVFGGGSYSNAGSPKFEGCVFINNNATSWGGGAYLNNASATLTDCTLEGNDAQILGGGIRVSGGTCVITRCTLLNNSSLTEGGAIEAEGTAQLTVKDSWFEGNSCGDAGDNGRGGAIHIAGTTSSAAITNSVFFNNTCNRFGGALYAARPIVARNCTFYGNLAATNNQGVVGAASGTLQNCIAWNNGPNSTISNLATYSNIEGGFAGTGNIGGDSSDAPLFVDAANGDLRLLAGSPGIDAGNTALLPPSLNLDLDDNPRVVNGLASGATGVPVFGYFVDMGAFEYQPQGTGPPSNCTADIAPPGGDGAVNVSDLLKVISDWGSCPR